MIFGQFDARGLLSSLVLIQNTIFSSYKTPTVLFCGKKFQPFHFFHPLLLLQLQYLSN